MRRITGACVCGALLLPATAYAQTLNGLAEWTAVRGGNGGDSQATTNQSLWQRYTVGLTTPILDPRLMTCSAETSFRSSTLSTGSESQLQQGRQTDLAYKFAASVFPARPFPFFFEASRDNVGESGDYPTSTGMRGGLAVPSGTPLAEFRTRNDALNMGGQLSLPDHPRVEFGYRTGRSDVTGGEYDATQSDTNLHLGVMKDTPRVQQSLRWEKTAFQNTVSQVFDQRTNDLNYDMSLSLGSRSRAHARTGRRRTFSLFDLAPRFVDSGPGGYAPPTRGEVQTEYVIAGVTYEPGRRVSIDFTANADHQTASAIETSARLTTSSARYEPGRGLSLSAAGTFGDRGELINDVPVMVRTRNGQVGFTYRAGRPWLEASVGATRGVGTGVTPEGESGTSASRTEQVSLSTSSRLANLSLGAERQRSTDDILVFGNYAGQRTFGSVQREIHSLSLSVSLENARVERGLDLELTRYRQETFTVAASYRRRNHTVTVNAGGFKNDSDLGLDTTSFIGGGYQGQLTRAIHATAWLRREVTIATQTGLDQRGLSGLADLKYRYRQFTFGIEYRRVDQHLVYQRLLQPFVFRGHQFQAHVSRVFGIRL